MNNIIVKIIFDNLVKQAGSHYIADIFSPYDPKSKRIYGYYEGEIDLEVLTDDILKFIEWAQARNVDILNMSDEDKAAFQLEWESIKEQ